MSSGFKINKQAIARMQRDIQREMNKHPVTVPVQMETPTSHGWSTDSARNDVTNFYGPVIYGDANGAQLAWNNGSVSQTQNSTPQDIAAGFEAVASAVAQLLQEVPGSGLDQDARDRLAEPAAEVLTEVVETEPDKGKIRAALERIKGVLAPAALAITTGAAEGAAEWAKHAISSLDVPF
jgi:hypothetical protein